MAVRKAEKSGRIQKLPDGTYDEEASLKGLARNVEPSRTKVRTANQKEVRTEPVATPEAFTPRPAQIRSQEDARTAVEFIRQVLQAEGVEAGEIDYYAARTADTILKAHERDLKIAERRRELVPLLKVKEHVEKAFIGIRQAIQRLPSRHVPGMAAELGVDPATLDRVLSKAIAAELDELSAPVVRA